MRVSIGDVRLFFDVAGEKLRPAADRMVEVPTLLLLHGGPGWDHSAFKPTMSRLASVAQVVYLDHRGNGRSDPSTPDLWTLDRWADDVVRFCEVLEIVRPVVLGSSFGGTVAMNYAARHPGHAAGLILTNTTAKRRPDLVLDTFERLGGPEAREIARRYIEAPDAAAEAAYLKTCVPLYGRARRLGLTDTAAQQARAVRRPEVVYHYYNGGADGRGGEVKRMDLLPALGRIDCPTLVMAGGDDPITPIGCAREIVAALRPDRVRFEVFEGCGHALIEDDTDRFLLLIAEFVTQIGEAGRP